MMLHAMHTRSAAFDLNVSPHINEIILQNDWVLSGNKKFLCVCTMIINQSKILHSYSVLIVHVLIEDRKLNSL